MAWPDWPDPHIFETDLHDCRQYEEQLPRFRRIYW